MLMSCEKDHIGNVDIESVAHTWSKLKPGRVTKNFSQRKKYEKDYHLNCCFTEEYLYRVFCDKRCSSWCFMIH